MRTYLSVDCIFRGMFNVSERKVFGLSYGRIRKNFNAGTDCASLSAQVLWNWFVARFPLGKKKKKERNQACRMKCYEHSASFQTYMCRQWCLCLRSVETQT